MSTILRSTNIIRPRWLFVLRLIPNRSRSVSECFPVCFDTEAANRAGNREAANGGRSGECPR